MFARTNRWLARTASIALTVSAVAAHAASIDCAAVTDDQQSVQAAINALAPGEVLNVAGACENVSLTIRQPQITLRGPTGLPASLIGNGSAPVIRVVDSGEVNLLNLVVSEGSVGVEYVNARGAARNVTVQDNVTAGFAVNAGSTLLCTNCEASANGKEGFSVSSSLALCGRNVVRNNAAAGVLMALGGKLFSSQELCGVASRLRLEGNDVGLSLFQNASVIMLNFTLISISNRWGIWAYDGSALMTRGSDVSVRLNTAGGIAMGDSALRLNDDPTGGSTAISSNSGAGLIVDDGSMVKLGAIDISGNQLLGMAVQNFSTASAFGPGPHTVQSTLCHPGKSGGTFCP